MVSPRIQRIDINQNRRTRIRLQQQNYMLRDQRRSLIQTMASSLMRRSCNRPTILPDLVAQENEQRFENILLRSELETLTCFMGKLNLVRRQLPSATASSFMAAMSLKEVISLTRIGTPIWTNERLDLNQYYSHYFPWYARNVAGFIHEASRVSGLVSCDALSLVTDLMNPMHWKQIFPTIVVDVHVESHPHPQYQLINVEFMSHVSPLVPTRNVKLFRCSTHIENDTWVIADISMYFSSYAPHLRPAFLRFPSGYLIQHLTNGVSKVTVLDHWAYKVGETINLFNQNSEMGAQKWLTALQRHFYNTGFLLVPSISNHIQIFDPIYHTNLLNLSTVMVNQFCTGVCGATTQNWKRLTTLRFPYNYIGIFTRETQDMSHVPCVLISSIGLVRMRGRPEVIFGSINRARKEDIWNYLQPVGDMQEIIYIKRSPNLGNEISVFKFQDWYMIKETHYEASEVMIIHACIEASYFTAAIIGGDFSGINLLPCGFTIAPCGQVESFVSCGYQVMENQATMITSSGNMVEYLEKIVTNTLRNVVNHLSSQ